MLVVLWTTVVCVAVSRAAPPVIHSFEAEDNVIRPDALAVLKWNITGADSATIEPGFGAVPVPSGEVSEFLTRTTTYTLTAKNAEGTATAEVTVWTPLAIGVTEAAWTVKQAFARTSATGTIDSLTKADIILNAPTGDQALLRAPVIRENVPFIDYANPAAGVFGYDQALPGGNGDHFAVRATATLVVNVPGVWTFGINNNDGGRLLIDLNGDGDFYKNPAVNVHSDTEDIYDPGEAVIVDNMVRDAAVTTTGQVTLAAGTYKIEYVFFDRTGGMAGEVFAYMGGEPMLLEFTPALPPIVTPDLIISEIMADNESGLQDAEGSREDWIEIYNGTPNPVNLRDYYLSDTGRPDLWRFPDAALAPGEYLVVFASGKNTTFGEREFHTNFRLSAGGEPLGLYKSDGAGGFTRVSGWDAYPPQYTDRSWGVYDSEHYTGFFFTPTPGAINNGGCNGFIPPVRFSVPRGFYTQPQALTFTFPAEIPDPQNFEIRYTTNGSPPSPGTGTLYTHGQPVVIDKTVTVRAAAVRKNWRPSATVTQTYIFLDDVIRQSTTTAREKGFPTSSVNGQVYRYPMNTTLANSQGPALKQALSAIPSLSLVIDQRDFSDRTNGIYSNASRRGIEVPASLELLNEDGQGGGHFQIDCGVRIRGGFSRSADNPKHSFRLFFRNRYAGPLEYPIFQSEGASRFKKLDLRTSQNYSWSFNSDGAKNTFLREELSRMLQGATGQPYSRVRYFHLYINGVYWGLYDTDERFDESFGESYLGGDEDNYDVVKSAGNDNGYQTEASEGVLNTLPAGTPPRPGDELWSTTKSAWRVLWEKVRAGRASPEAADAVFWEVQGLQPDGKTPLPGNPPPLLDVDNLIDYMLVSWYCGSHDAPLNPGLTSGSNNWAGFRNPETRRGFVFGVHDFEHSMGADRSLNSFDRIGPWGGSGAQRNIYNSLPSSDPLYRFRKQPPATTQNNARANFSTSNPAWLHEDLAFNSQEYRTRVWDRAHKHFFNGGALTDEAVLAKLDELRATVDKAILAEQARWGNTSNYTKAAWQTEVNFLKTWIARGSVPGQPLTTNYGRAKTIVTLMRGYSDGSHKPLYSPIEAPVFNQMGGKVDDGWSLTMTIPPPNDPAGAIYFTTNGEDPRAPGGAINAAGGATVYTGPVAVAKSARVKARVWDGTNWSALTEAYFTTAAPASAANLIITEINYNPRPGAPGTAEDPQLYEFIELQNAGSGVIDLSGARFTTGINFTFPEGLHLEAGGRLVLAKDLAAFQSRYPDAEYPGLSAKTLAGYEGALANGGERLTLLAVDGSVIRDFTYGDSAPWPAEADGGGATLVFTRDNPLAADANVPQNWAAHARLHGNPGGPDHDESPVGGYAAWAAAHGVGAASPAEDSDGDGIPNLLEYVFGTHPREANGALPVSAGIAEISVNGAPAERYQTFTFSRSLDAADVTLTVETSPDLTPGSWSANTVEVSREPNGSGMETVVARAPLPLSAAPRLFMRLRASPSAGN